MDKKVFGHIHIKLIVYPAFIAFYISTVQARQSTRF